MVTWKHQNQLISHLLLLQMRCTVDFAFTQTWGERRSRRRIDYSPVGRMVALLLSEEIEWIKLLRGRFIQSSSFSSSRTLQTKWISLCAGVCFLIRDDLPWSSEANAELPLVHLHLHHPLRSVWLIFNGSSFSEINSIFRNASPFRPPFNQVRIFRTQSALFQFQAFHS